MLRASATCEAAGFPTASITCEGFLGQAAATSIGLGMANLPVALVPGHVAVQSNEELRRNVAEVTVDRIIASLTAMPAQAKAGAQEPGARDIVCSGDFETVNRYFLEHQLSDGLPIVPPTREKIDEFLRYTDRPADDVLGVLLPDKRAATVWSIAVNGVMAGCRPEYMPILVALIEAMADDDYGVEHSGNTPGGETLIILNGPLIKTLGFNYTQGVMRDGFQPNTSIGRFWRLYLRNVAGFLPHQTDKATFGNTWRVVVAENEDTVKKIGWEPISADMGHAAGDDTVTIGRYTGGHVVSSVSGSTPEEILPNLNNAILLNNSWHITFTVGQGYGKLRPLMFLSPILAETIAKAGWSKQDVKRYLFEHARIPAWQFERQLRDWSHKPVWNLADEVLAGNIPKFYHESDDPNRLVPIVWKPDDYMIAVTGDPLRTNAYVFGHNGQLGYTVAKRVQLPRDWDSLLAAARGN